MPKDFDPEFRITPEAIAGLTKREWFAGMALQGLMATKKEYSKVVVVREAIHLADAMLKGLKA